MTAAIGSWQLKLAVPTATAIASWQGGRGRGGEGGGEGFYVRLLISTSLSKN